MSQVPMKPYALSAETLATHAVGQLWHDAALPPDALQSLLLTGHDPVLASSFAVSAAAQASMAAAALAAAQWGAGDATPATVALDMRHAAYECLSFYMLNGVQPNPWDKYSGAYRCADGWVRIHANFAHHRDGALALLGLRAGDNTSKSDVEHALQSWRAQDFEQAAADKGLVVAALRRHVQWQAQPQALALQAEPVVAIQKIANSAEPVRISGQKQGEFLGSHKAPPAAAQRPLQGLRVLDLTRILAGPICGRALAAWGADVMLVNSPHLPNIDAIADTSRGKRSVHIDLQTAEGRETLKSLIRQADVFVQGYRPGALAALGFGPHDVAALRPGIVYVSLAAYGHSGPWRERRGFDSLVQTATGLNDDESAAAGLDLAQHAPRTLPMQILDHGSGYLMAFGALAALLRQRAEGGSWQVQVSLARTGAWLRSLGRVEQGFAVDKPDLKPYLYSEDSGFGRLTAVRHAVHFNGQPCTWALPSMPPGSHPPVW